MTWATSLARAIHPRDHAPLRTLADAAGYLLELPAGIAGYQAWQHAGQLLLAAAENPTRAAIDDATRQLELALFTTGQQNMSESS
jgi:IS5 family transposase